MAKRPTFKCVCTACGWRSARGTKNMYKPCPKCGGAVTFQSSEDQTAVQIAGIIALVLCGALALLMAVAKPD